VVGGCDRLARGRTACRRHREREPRRNAAPCRLAKLALLRNASLWSADDAAKEAARRRLGVIRDALHAQSTPRFGRREGVISQPLTEDEHYRKLLGLPLDQRLNAPEIHRAFKRAAKAVHPDAGGDTEAFLELAAARDALMKQGIRYR